MSNRLLSVIEKLRTRSQDIVHPEPPAPLPCPVTPDIESAVSAFLAEIKSHPAFQCAHPRHLEQPNGE